ncbi:MAG: DHHA1 domain-containing protein [Candidatus Aenigmatarchaeota archaeon]
MNWNITREFLGDIEDPIVIYHRDADGVCSAAIMSELVGANTCLPNDGPGIQIMEELVGIINESKSVVFVDLPVDQLDIIDKLNLEKIFVLDHHPPEKDLSDGNILHINPRFEDDEIYQPAAYLSYQVAKNELENIGWKAGVGVVGDHGVEDCGDLMEDIRKERPELIGNRKLNYEELKDSTLGTIAEMIDAAKVVKRMEGIKTAFNTIQKAEDPNDVYKTKLTKYYEKYKKELEKIKDRFREEAEYFPDANAYLFCFENIYSLTSTLSNQVADENPEAIVIIGKQEDGLKLSARCQSGRINVAEVLKESAEGLGNAGGHPQASGGYIPDGKVDVFLERLRHKLERMD